MFRKKDLTEKYGVYQGKQYSLINDLAAWLTLLSQGKAVYIAEPLSYFRLHLNQNNNKMGLKVFSEWLEIILASREDGFLDSDNLFKTALHSYHRRIKGYPQFGDDIERIKKTLKLLD
ncbi:hypothetical protein V7247_29960 [Priestia megaterium]|uniref:hypothetical protein n=1 Tax=Priestia megaterium TaxID=1404 RepID=UPI0030007071